MLGPEKTIRIIIKRYDAEGGARKALLPAPLGGSCEAAKPNEDDRRRASDLRIGPMDHMDNERHLAYRIVPGSPLGPMASLVNPQSRDQIEKQIKALREFRKTQQQAFNNPALRMDLHQRWVSMRRRA